MRSLIRLHSANIFAGVGHGVNNSNYMVAILHIGPKNLIYSANDKFHPPKILPWDNEIMGVS